MNKNGRAITGRARGIHRTIRLSIQELEALKQINENISHAIRTCIRKVCKIKVDDNNYQKRV